MRLVGAAIVVLGVFVTATAVRRADQVVASGRDVLLGGELVDLFTAGDLSVSGHAQLAGTAVALGDLDVSVGSLRVERDAARVFAVGGGVTVGENAAVVFPETATLRYGTIRTGAVGGSDTVVRDVDAVARYAAMVPALRASSECFGRAPSTGLVRADRNGITLIGDGTSGLQVFNIDGSFVGPVLLNRIPRSATVLINLYGASIEIAPTGAGWDEIAEATLVNVPDAGTVEIATGLDLRLNSLVGSDDGQVVVDGNMLEGTLLSLSDIDVGDTRIAHGPVLAPMLPECGMPTAEPAEAPASTVAPDIVELVETTLDSSSTTSTTSTTTTTTTTVATGDEPLAASPVPGAAFALGGAATASHWWVGLPLVLLGSVILGWGWLERHLRWHEVRRRRAEVRVMRRLAARGPS